MSNTARKRSRATQKGSISCNSASLPSDVEARRRQVRKNDSGEGRDLEIRPLPSAAALPSEAERPLSLPPHAVARDHFLDMQAMANAAAAASDAERSDVTAVCSVDAQAEAGARCAYDFIPSSDEDDDSMPPPPPAVLPVPPLPHTQVLQSYFLYHP